MQVEIYEGTSWHSISSYIAIDGFKISRNDVDGPAAGRNVAGDMIRDRVAIKTRIDITFITMTHDQWYLIHGYLLQETFSFRYRESASDAWTTITAYSNSYSWTTSFRNSQGVMMYTGMTVPVVEV